MKSEQIEELFRSFEAAAIEFDGVECWSAREIQKLLGYSKWENFEKVIDKAKIACSNAGEAVQDHFPDIRKMVDIGDQALFNLSTQTFKRKLGVPDNRPVADFLPTISIKAKDLSAEMTGLNIQSKDLKGQNKIEREHIDNNLAVRRMLLEREIVPEDLPAAEDVKKLQRKLKTDESKILKTPKKR